MKAMMLYTASGPLVILTSYDSPTAPDLLGKLKAKGITKFIASLRSAAAATQQGSDLLGGGLT